MLDEAKAQEIYHYWQDYIEKEWEKESTQKVFTCSQEYNKAKQEFIQDFVLSIYYRPFMD